MEIRLWIVTSCLGIVLIILGFFLKTWFRQIVSKLGDLVQKMELLGETKAVHAEQLKYLHEGQAAAHNRLNDHSKRIRNLEMKYNERNS